MRTRFAHEYSCDESDVAVSPVGGAVYHASGCGKSADFACESAASMGKVMCEEEGLPRRASPGPDPASFAERTDRIPPTPTK